MKVEKEKNLVCRDGLVKKKKEKMEKKK